MIKKGSTLGVLLFLLVLILFDAFQQKFYIDTFQLASNPVSITELLKVQSVRWAVWFFFSLPLGLIAWKLLTRDSLTNLSSKILILSSVLFTIFLAVAAISWISMIGSNQPSSWSIFIEFFIFLSFQKGLTFFMAYATVILIILSYGKSREMELQSAEITSLRETTEELSRSLHQTDQGKSLTIKTGSKLHSIPLDKIIWIQADDYCVKIHTEHRTYSLRKSLKLLEEQLRPFRFIRIHRGAILNLQYVEQINFDNSTIKLQNESELPLSKSGIKTLRSRMRESVS